MNLKNMLIKEGIVKIKQISEEPFILNELGDKSRIYFDIKEASLNPEVLKNITRDIINMITEDIPDLAMTHSHFSDSHLYLFNKIGSVAVGGVPVSTSLSLETNIPQIIVRNCIHDRGTQTKVIGNCSGENVIFIEDVSVTGASIIKGIKTIRDAGGICNTCIVIIDREEGAEQNCKDNGINLYSLLKKSDFGINEEL